MAPLKINYNCSICSMVFRRLKSGEAQLRVCVNCEKAWYFNSVTTLNLIHLLGFRCFRTWFYYAVKGAPAGKYVKMNIMNLNRQFRLFQQGMSPVYRVLPHKPQWERIREKPSYMVSCLLLLCLLDSQPKVCEFESWRVVILWTSVEIWSFVLWWWLHFMLVWCKMA